MGKAETMAVDNMLKGALKLQESERREREIKKKKYESEIFCGLSMEMSSRQAERTVL